MTPAQSAGAIACVPELIALARDADMTASRVVVAFQPGHPDARTCLTWDTQLPAAGQTVYDLAPALHYRSSGTWIRLPM
jgi:hypothetical protein